MIEQFMVAMDDGTYQTVTGEPFAITILGEEYKFFAHLDYLQRPACTHANTGKRVCFLDCVDVKHAEREVWGLAKQFGLPIFTYKLKRGF